MVTTIYYTAKVEADSSLPKIYGTCQCESKAKAVCFLLNEGFPKDKWVILKELF